jgi:hypothetical protein
VLEVPLQFLILLVIVIIIISFELKWLNWFFLLELSASNRTCLKLYLVKKNLFRVFIHYGLTTANEAWHTGEPVVSDIKDLSMFLFYVGEGYASRSFSGSAAMCKQWWRTTPVTLADQLPVTQTISNLVNSFYNWVAISKNTRRTDGRRDGLINARKQKYKFFAFTRELRRDSLHNQWGKYDL